METQSKLSAFFEDEIKAIYWTEKHLVKFLPKMVKASTSDQLIQALEVHIKMTVEHVARLEEVFDALGRAPVTRINHAIKSILDEAESVVQRTQTDSLTRECELFFAAQKIAHSGIATYGSLYLVANLLGNKEVAELLQIAFIELKETDKHLLEIAESFTSEGVYKE